MHDAALMCYTPPAMELYVLPQSCILQVLGLACRRGSTAVPDSAVPGAAADGMADAALSTDVSDVSDTEDGRHQDPASFRMSRPQNGEVASRSAYTASDVPSSRSLARWAPYLGS